MTLSANIHVETLKERLDINSISHQVTVTCNHEPSSLLSMCAHERQLPPWLKEQLHHWGERFCLPEWDADDDDVSGEDEIVECFRSKHGWKGSDLCHSKTSPVRVSHYAVQQTPEGIGTTLTGLVHFKKNAESHRGYCHGGSMTTAMDDIIGWTAFHVKGQCHPWSGFTAQINVTLKRPVEVGSYLKAVGKVVRWEGRKVWVLAALLTVQSEEEDIEHCTADGLVILNRESSSMVKT